MVEVLHEMRYQQTLPAQSESMMMVGAMKDVQCEKLRISIQDRLMRELWIRNTLETHDL